jgi:uncharacterized membrane protein
MEESLFGYVLDIIMFMALLLFVLYLIIMFFIFRKLGKGAKNGKKKKEAGKL